MARIDERKKQEEKEEQELNSREKVNSLAKKLFRDMVEEGNNLDSYMAMLNARRISKQVNIDSSRFFKRTPKDS